MDKIPKRAAEDVIGDNQPQQKRHKGDVDVDNIEAKISEIRQSVENANKKEKKKNKNKKGNQNEVETQNQPTAFDYAAADFTRFQGGSKQNQKQPEVQTRFRGKVSYSIRFKLSMDQITKETPLSGQKQQSEQTIQ